MSSVHVPFRSLLITLSGSTCFHAQVLFTLVSYLVGNYWFSWCLVCFHSIIYIISSSLDAASTQDQDAGQVCFGRKAPEVEAPQKGAPD